LRKRNLTVGAAQVSALQIIFSFSLFIFSLLENTMLYKQSGTGNAVLFFHGFPFDHTMWLPMEQYLDGEYRLLMPDLRGFGQTTLPVGKTTPISQFADDAKELLTRAEITSKVVVCGLSMGGYIAQHFAKRFPDLLAGLVLCDTKSAADSEASAENRKRRADGLAVSGLAALADSMLPNLFAPNVDAERVQMVRQMILRQPLDGVAAADRGMAERPDTTAWLPEIQVPTLVICGEQDKISSVEEMRTMAKQIPQSEFATIPAAGHLSPLESPKEFADVLKRFLQRVFPANLHDETAEDKIR